MTNASQSTRTVVEHCFAIPCKEPWGGTWDDFSVARAWAEQKAQKLGINTGYAGRPNRIDGARRGLRRNPLGHRPARFPENHRQMHFRIQGDRPAQGLDIQRAAPPIRVRRTWTQVFYKPKH